MGMAASMAWHRLQSRRAPGLELVLVHTTPAAMVDTEAPALSWCWCCWLIGHASLAELGSLQIAGPGSLQAQIQTLQVQPKG